MSVRVIETTRCRLGMDETRRLLDKIDIKAYFDNEKSLSKVMQLLEDNYDNTESTNTELLEGCIFNWMNISEFIDYLYARYGNGITIEENTDYDVYL